MAMNHSRSWRTISVTAALSWLMKLSMAGLIPYNIYRGDYLFTVLTVVSVALSIVPSVLQRNYRITLPFELDLLITLSIFLNTFMGEGLNLYSRVWLYDKVLHVYGSAVIALLAFVITYTFHYTKRWRLSLPMVGFFTVTFAMAVGGLWEIGEFAVDSLFGKTTQDGLADTMWDMINDLVGGMVAAVLGMVYVKYSKPQTRKRLTKPLGEVFGLGRRIDRLKKKFEEQRTDQNPLD